MYSLFYLETDNLFWRKCLYFSSTLANKLTFIRPGLMFLTPIGYILNQRFFHTDPLGFEPRVARLTAGSITVMLQVNLSYRFIVLAHELQ